MGRLTRRGIGKGEEEVSEKEALALSDEDIEAIREAALEWATERYSLGQHNGLSMEALRLIYVICNPLTGRFKREWARVANVGHQVYYRWRDKPGWQKTLNDMREQLRPRQLSEADSVLDELLHSTDDKVRLAAARTIYEREGQFIQRVETTRVEKPAEQRAFERAMAKRKQNDSDTQHLN